MSDLRAEEQADSIIEYLDGGFSHDGRRGFIIGHLQEAEQAAEARMRERCCKAMCDLCREGDKPAYGEVGIHHDFYHYKEGSIFCRASAIRRGGRA